MERTDMNALQLQRLTDVADGIWGTIGPCFENACREMAAFAGAKHALLVHSAQAALEAILRAKNIGFGDQVGGEHSEGIVELFRGHKSKPSFVRWSFRPRRVRWSRLLALLSVMPQ